MTRKAESDAKRDAIAPARRRTRQGGERPLPQVPAPTTSPWLSKDMYSATSRTSSTRPSSP